ncbi:hypothetical protein EJ110_NYTH21758 [Nymphaea thermarum]|nr:hypothetical protein EJ110_NYTH21758 [Nymphaea thermarum]
MASPNFQLDNGDIIDCVDFYSQPAMRDPLIRQNALSRAKFLPQGTIAAKNESHELGSDKLGRIDLCPPGTIPFFKATKAGPLNHSAIADFARSRANFFLRSTTIKPMASIKDYEVDPASFGDARTRFYFVTANDTKILHGESKKEPVENNDLEFVRHSNYMPCGGEISPTSTIWHQREIRIRIKKGEQNDNRDWDLFVDDNLIGFWPSKNYRNRFSLADQVVWGGHIKNTKRNGRHTSTQMGSGEFAWEGVGKAAYISKMGLYVQNKQLYDAPETPSTYASHPHCYSLVVWPPNEFYGHHMTLGGPGYDEQDFLVSLERAVQIQNYCF